MKSRSIGLVRRSTVVRSIAMLSSLPLFAGCVVVDPVIPRPNEDALVEIEEENWRKMNIGQAAMCSPETYEWIKDVFKEMDW